MWMVRRFAMIALASLSLALCLPAATAQASVRVSARTVTEGNATTITVTGCSDPARYAGAWIDIVDLEGIVVDSAIAPTSTTTPATATLGSQLLPGAYTARVDCLGYGGRPDSLGSTGFMVLPRLVTLSTTTWSPGHSVRVASSGYRPGEQVRLALVDATGHQVYLVTLGTADAAGAIVATTAPSATLPSGTYTVVVMGAVSGLTAMRGITWAGDSKPQPAPSPDPLPRPSPRPPSGLPETGGAGSADTGLAMVASSLAVAGIAATRRRRHSRR